MQIAYWIVATVLAVIFAASGMTKIIKPKPALAAVGLTYVEKMSTVHVKAIGALEVLGAFGVILPRLTNIAPILAPTAALALAVLMIGAVAVHVRRKEKYVPPLVLAVLAAATVILGIVALA